MIPYISLDHKLKNKKFVKNFTPFLLLYDFRVYYLKNNNLSTRKQSGVEHLNAIGREGDRTSKGRRDLGRHARGEIYRSRNRL
jgi:hypothetical protein